MGRDQATRHLPHLGTTDGSVPAPAGHLGLQVVPAHLPAQGTVALLALDGTARGCQNPPRGSALAWLSPGCLQHHGFILPDKGTVQPRQEGQGMPGAPSPPGPMSGRPSGRLPLAFLL